MELVVSASEFKAKCLGILKQLDHCHLSRVIITHRGRPVATMGRAEQPAGDDWINELQREMAGTVVCHDPDFDLTAPIFDGELDAAKGILHN